MSTQGVPLLNALPVFLREDASAVFKTCTVSPNRPKLVCVWYALGLGCTVYIFQRWTRTFCHIGCSRHQFVVIHRQ